MTDPRPSASSPARRFCGLLLLIGLFAAATAIAQGPPPPPPLGPPPIPPGNPQTPAKIALGKTLFWEEQLSVTGTVACGSCHSPNAAGADARTRFALAATINPGADGVIGTDDDIHASAGVPAHAQSGLYQPSLRFGLRPQVGGRKSPSAINAAYAPLLFWDGRAGGSFSDPLTGQVLIPVGGALENQALGPLLDTAEMAPSGAVIAGLAQRIQNVRPLALAPVVPAALSSWIARRAYPALFAEVFGTTEITPARIAFAIASYERTLNANQTPFDAENGGTPSLTAQELQGRQVFVANDCAACHAGPLLSDNQFSYIGVRPTSEDPGRFAQTGNPQDRGAMRTPGLRNVADRAPYMHNGRFATLEEVVDFYLRGGDFDAPNKDPRVQPRALTAQQRAALLAFLRRPLTDPRVAVETAPFDRPTLYSESSRVPVIIGSGRAGSGGAQPQISAIEPPLIGSSNFTVAITQGLGGALATLVVASSDPGVQSSIPAGEFAELSVALAGSGAGQGYGSVNLALPDRPGMLGSTLYGRVYIADPGAANGYAVTPAFQIAVFGESDLLGQSGFE